MNKKASMQLGINAIVVLIIALAILGLAMSFITGLFRESRVKYETIIGRTDLEFHADSITPIMFESDDITVKAGKEEKVDVSVYNTWFADTVPITLDIIGCIDNDGNEAWDVTMGEEPFLSIIVSPQTIPTGADGGFRTIVSAKKANAGDAGTYICTVQAGEWDEYLGIIKEEPVPISDQVIITVIR